MALYIIIHDKRGLCLVSKSINVSICKLLFQYLSFNLAVEQPLVKI